jgi:hypothetical protein
MRHKKVKRQRLTSFRPPPRLVSKPCGIDRRTTEKCFQHGYGQNPHDGPMHRQGLALDPSLSIMCLRMDIQRRPCSAMVAPPLPLAPLNLSFLRHITN